MNKNRCHKISKLISINFKFGLFFIPNDPIHLCTYLGVDLSRPMLIIGVVNRHVVYMMQDIFFHCWSYHSQITHMVTNFTSTGELRYGAVECEDKDGWTFIYRTKSILEGPSIAFVFASSSTLSMINSTFPSTTCCLQCHKVREKNKKWQ